VDWVLEDFPEKRSPEERLASPLSEGGEVVLETTEEVRMSRLGKGKVKTKEIRGVSSAGSVSGPRGKKVGSAGRLFSVN